MKIIMHIPSGRLSSDYCLTQFDIFKEYLRAHGTIYFSPNSNRFSVCFPHIPGAIKVTIDEFELVEVDTESL